MTTPYTPLYREIKLTQGQVALVSAHRFEELNAHKWCACWRKSTRSFYAMRNVRLPNGTHVLMSMHRVILGLEYGDRRQGDHVNLDTLDCRDENLRIATHGENQRNKGIRVNNKSGFKGVSWSSLMEKWKADICLNGKHHHLGYFKEPEIAYASYCMAAKQLHGDFSREA